MKVFIRRLLNELDSDEANVLFSANMFSEGKKYNSYQNSYVIIDK